MQRRGESYSKDGIILTPYMMGANAYVDIQHSDTTVSLTKLEFDCLKSGISKVKDYYDFLKLLVIDDSDQIDILFSYLCIFMQIMYWKSLVTVFYLQSITTTS